MKKISIPYLCIYNKLKERTGNRNIINKHDCFRIMGETFHIPKQLRPAALKQMEQEGMIKDLGSTRSFEIEILKINLSVSDVNKIYKILGLF